MDSLVLFDWETTSPEPKTARGVQFAAIDITADGVNDLFNLITDPEVDIHHEAAEIHGISAEMCRGQIKDFEVAAQFLEAVDEAVAEGQVVITGGHNSRTFDIPITIRLAKMAGYQGTCDLLPHVDTMILSQRVWPLAPSFRLSASEEEAKKEGAIGLIQWRGLGTGEGAHDARADIHMVRALLVDICAETGKTVPELAAWLATPFVHDICHFGKHRGKRWGKGPGTVPWFYVKWCCENWTDANLDLQATILHHYGLSFRFRGALR